MFNMGFTELIVLGAIALIVIGPKQLPEVAKVIASLVNEFKRATRDITDSFSDVKKEINETVKDAQTEVTDAEAWIKEQARKVLEERKDNTDDKYGAHDKDKEES